MLVEQAIYASARTPQADGYQIIAASAGVTAADRRELARWCPSHDGISTEGPASRSVNFFRLTSGTYCVSQSGAAHAEYSGRGGTHVRTRCYLLSPAVLARFGNNPFKVLQAVEARSSDRICDGPKDLQPLRVHGCSTLLDSGVLLELAVSNRARNMARLVDAAISGERLLVRGAHDAETLCAGLMSALPTSLRPAISFSTGLLPSLRRPFRLIFIPADTRRTARRSNEVVLDLASSSDSQDELGDWARLVHETVTGRNLSRLVAELKRTDSPLVPG